MFIAARTQMFWDMYPLEEAVEKIAQLGYSAEIELWGEDIVEIENKFLEILNLLEIPLNLVTSNTLAYIVAEHLDLLNNV